MSEPPWCQIGAGCRRPRTFTVTYRTAPVRGRFPGPGLELVQGTCGPCRTTLVGQLLAAGGEILDIEEIVQPPQTVTVEPIRMAAVTPAAPDEPVKVRIQRRRKAKVTSG